jgi:hypothetical protein
MAHHDPGSRIDTGGKQTPGAVEQRLCGPGEDQAAINRGIEKRAAARMSLAIVRLPRRRHGYHDGTGHVAPAGILVAESTDPDFAH